MRRVADPSHEARNKESGFALVEVIVAFAILSLTLIVLYQGAGEQARGARHVAVKIEAMAFAQSLLASVGYEQPLRTGLQHGEAPQGYRWTVEISPYKSQRAQPSSPLKGYWVEVSIAGERSDVSLILLRTIKLAPADG